MVSLILRGLVFYVILIVAWKVLRRLFVKSPLECIPGPPALSFIGGRSNAFIVMAIFLLSFQVMSNRYFNGMDGTTIMIC